MTIVLATRNQKKIEEIRRVIPPSKATFLSLDAFQDQKIPTIVEDGDTFLENAAKKAATVARATGQTSLADDSGLVVDALDGAPGVFSARYAGLEATDRQNLEKVLDALRDVPEADRTARFVCVLALATPEGSLRSFSGVVEGRIAKTPRGDNGFGYDPVFVPQEQTGRYGTRTFAQMSAVEKDGMSHRGRALKALAKAEIELI